MSGKLHRTFDLHALFDFRQIFNLLKEFAKHNDKSQMSKKSTFENIFSKMFEKKIDDQKKVFSKNIFSYFVNNIYYPKTRSLDVQTGFGEIGRG